jgi:hypothetical protein
MIFLSYASQDAEAAARIGDALREAGLEVWFDHSELRGGDAWDQLIRRRIRECALFVPVISAHTQTRLEGYFRLEWKLAVERTHLMADGVAFLVPVAIDAIDERQAHVPESFRAVQWTTLPGGTVTTAFIDRIGQLLSGSSVVASAPAGATAAMPPVTGASASAGRSAWGQRAIAVAVALLALGAAWLLIERLARNHPAPPVTAAGGAEAASIPSRFSPPAHSLAVLPFTNMSGDPKDD